MSTASGIKSGMAYVQAYLDDNPLTQGLTKLRAKLISWQSKLGSMGSKAYGGQLPEPFAAVARFATSPAGVFTGLLGAAKHTAEVREQMLRMSETAGVSVEHFSAAAYAANKYGVSMEALAAGLKRMETKEFAAMLGGGKGGGKGGGGMKGFAKGLFGGLGGGDAMDRMIALARKMEGQSAEIQAGMARAAGMGDLLPMLRQGGDALEADIRHAKELGLVLSGPDAEAAEKFGFAWKDLQAVIGNAVGQIGGALLPLLTGLTRMVSRVALATRDWVKQHKTLVIGLFAAAAAIVAGGIALKLMAVGVSLATTAVAVMKGVVLLASGAWTLLTGIVTTCMGIMGSAAMPFILLGAALVGILAYIGYVGGAFDNLGKQWTGFSEDTSSSISAISNAIAKGDIEAAWNVVTAYLRTEWQRLKNSLWEIWEGLQHGLVEAIFGVEMVFSGFCDNVKIAFNSTVGYLRKLWAEWCQSQTVETTATFLHLGDLMAWWGKSAEQKNARQQLELLNNRGITEAVNESSSQQERKRWAEAQGEANRLGLGALKDPRLLADIAAGRHSNAASAGQVNQAMREDFTRGRANLPRTQSQIDAETERANAAVDKQRRQFEDQVGQAINLDKEARDQDMKAREADLAAKRKALKAAQAEANKPAEEEKKRTRPGGGELPGSGSVVGTFSGAVAAMLGGGGGVQRDQLDALERIDDHLAEIEKAAQRDSGADREQMLLAALAIP